MSNGVQEPVEDEGGGDQERVPLALHDGFLVAKELGGGAGVRFATGASLVFPVDVHEQEEAKGDDGEEGLEEIASDGDEALAEAVEAWDGEEEDHDRLGGGSVAKNNPF